jgi:hypothetical protein
MSYDADKRKTALETRVEELETCLAGLIDGIKAWARDEDGVHPDVWEAFSQAKGLLGHEWVDPEELAVLEGLEKRGT